MSFLVDEAAALLPLLKDPPSMTDDELSYLQGLLWEMLNLVSIEQDRRAAETEGE
ncbi:MAG TPA: hypothetical protein VIK98_03540 [Limnochordales bacterium]